RTPALRRRVIDCPYFSLERNGAGGSTAGPGCSERIMTGTTGTGKYELLLERCRGLEAVPTAVAHPCEETALAGAIEAGDKGLIATILVGPAAKLQEIAKKHSINLGKARIVDAAHSHASAAKAVELVRKGEAELLMKGSLHTDELLSAVVAKETGLR